MHCVASMGTSSMLSEGVFVALGSNVGDREYYVSKAIELLGGESEISIIKQSTMLETEPVGPINQGMFLNAVIEITTALSPKALLRVCLKIEEKLGRVRTKRWGPRTIDLDIVLFGNKIIHMPNLTIPHPELMNRSFVLVPLVEIAPDAVHPVTSCTAAEMLDSM